MLFIKYQEIRRTGFYLANRRNYTWTGRPWEQHLVRVGIQNSLLTIKGSSGNLQKIILIKAWSSFLVQLQVATPLRQAYLQIC